MIQGQWKSDGSDIENRDNTRWSCESLFDNGDAASIHVTAGRTGSPMNLLYDKFAVQEPSAPTPSTTPTPKKYFFQVKLKELSSSSVSVGMARPEEFKKGYGNRGMFYNGNLTNGTAALHVNFGPYLRTQDTVVLAYEETPETVTLGVYLNGKFLGTGFQIPRPDASVSATSFLFWPCLAIQGEVKVDAQVLLELPTFEGAQEDQAHPLEGEWSLVEACAIDDSSLAPTLFFPVTEFPDKKIRLTLEQQQNNDENAFWGMSIKVFNSMSLHLPITKELHGENYALGPIRGGGIISTRMMPPPPFVDVETKLIRCIETLWKSMVPYNKEEEGATSEELAILSLDGKTVAKCTRPPASTKAVCTSYKK